MKNKVTLLSAAITAALAAPAFAGINDIIISEYVEGSSYNKAVELTNIGSEDLEFPATIDIAFQKDGDPATWETILVGENSALKDITIPAGKSIVIHNPEPSRYDTNLLNAVGSNVKTHGAIAIPATLKHNGNDVIALRDITDPQKPVILDIVGVKDSENNWGKDVTLRRITTAEAPKATYDPKDWLTEVKNTFDGLGDPTLADKPADPIETTIGEIQGESFRSPLLDKGEYRSSQEYIVTGLVNAITEKPVKGFYLFDSDDNEKTSDGLFVKTNAKLSENMVGKVLRVTGYINEDYGMTTFLPSDNNWEEQANTSGYTAPVITDLTRIKSDGIYFRNTLERYEGMLVRLPEDMDEALDGKQDMRVSRTFSTDYNSQKIKQKDENGKTVYKRRNNMVLAYTRPNIQPNQENVAGSKESKRQAAENKDFRLYVDDGTTDKGVIPYYEDFNRDPQNNYIRINDSVVGLTGVINYSYGEFRLIPTQSVNSQNFIHNTPRRPSPNLDDKTEGNQFAIRIATQNVLNYFNSPFGGAENTHGNSRGADTSSEFQKQHDKIIEAIHGLNADIIGLMEIENNGFGDFSAISELVNAVNNKYTDDRYSQRNSEESVHNRYVFIGFDSDGNTILDENDSVGGDVITSGIIYRPNKVTLEYSKIIPMPSQKAPVVTKDDGTPLYKYDEIRENGKNYQRDTVAAVFKVNNTGKKLTIAVNHLKSKGSTCWEDWLGWEKWENFNPSKDKVKNDDFQGNCENFRVAAADHLGKEMAKMGGDQVVMGDMNSYANEDPMLVLTENPTGKKLKAAAYTFIGKMPQFGPNGAEITKSYGFLNAVSIKEKGHTSWSYSYNDEIGSLDHLLITPSLEKKLLDATDWHINAAESPLFDYNEEEKDKGANPDLFHPNVNAYRSSDHDSAIMALAYSYGETDGEPVLLSTTSGKADVEYAIPAKANAQKGDIAEIHFSPTPDEIEQVGLPREKLKYDGQKNVKFNVGGIKPGLYTVTMKLIRPTTTKSSSSEAIVPNSTVTMSVEVEKRDSLTPKTTTQPYDGSGGSFGIFGLLSMLGLGFLRRNKK